MSEYRESCRRLQQAIATLNQYIQKTQNSLTKFSTYLSNFFLARISKDYAQKKKLEEEAVLQTIDLIKGHRWLIHQLQLGTEEQKKLAHKALNTISQYNEIASTLNQKSRLWQQHIPKFLIKKIPMPAFPNTHRIELSLPVTTLNLSHKQVQKTAVTSDALSPTRLTQEERNAFWMKGITLLKGAGNPYLTIARTQKEVLNAPITIHVDSLSKKMSLSTTLSPLPGENYIFKGSFKCLPGGKRSLPLGQSFEITTQAIQTAFPGPLQYLGCFGNAMIPPCPHRAQEVEPLVKILEKKAQLAVSLLPQGELNQIAKEQLEKKRALFNQHSDELLPLHQQLLQHLIKNPQMEFFQHLYKREDALEQLSDVYRQFAELFIEKPFHNLQHQWLDGRNPSPIYLTYETKQALQQLKQQQTQEPFEEAKCQLLIDLGCALSTPCQSILMQHLSENLGFCPPSLSDFEKKLQKLLYRQLLTFFTELEEKRELTLEWIKHHMQLEIALFTKPSKDHLTEEAAHICERLERYFQSRFQVTN